MNTKAIFPMLAALLLVGSGAMARGSVYDDGEVPSAKVQYGDLDLTTKAGGKAMLVRISHAAIAVCGPRPYDPIWARYEFDPCVNRAIDRAVARLNNPIVSALNGGKASKDAVALASR